MIEPVTLLATFVTLWAQLHNYGIDVEANEHLRNIRVRRDIYGLRNNEQNVQKSLILNSIYNGREKENQHDKLQDAGEKDTGKLKKTFRAKRSYKTNYNGNNNRQISNIEGKVPLANYSPDSPYYSQNTDGVPYYYNSYNHNIGNGNNNVGNGNNNLDNGYNNVGNGNKLSNQHKTAVHGQSSVMSMTQHSNNNIHNDLDTTGQSNGHILKRMSQYVMPSNSLNLNNTNNGYHYNQGTTVTSNGYQSGYNQGINYNSYPNRNTNQEINSGSRQFYNPFGSQINGYNQTNGFTTQVTNNVYGIHNTGNGYNNGVNGYNNAGNWNNNFGNKSNTGGIWNYNTGFVTNNTRNGNYNTGIRNNSLGNGNNTANWNYNSGAIRNNTGNLNNYVGNSYNYAGNSYNYAGNLNNNVGNGTINADKGKNNTEKVQQSYFMSGLSCPQFFKSVTLFGTKMCLEDIDY